MKKQYSFLELMGEIDPQYIREASKPWESQNKIFWTNKIKTAAAAALLVIALSVAFAQQDYVEAAWNRFTSWIENALGIDESTDSYAEIIGKTIEKNGTSVTVEEVAGDKNDLWIAVGCTLADKDQTMIFLSEVTADGRGCNWIKPMICRKKIISSGKCCILYCKMVSLIIVNRNLILNCE